MSIEVNKQLVRDVMERGFNQGDLSVFDEYTDPNGVDHQSPPGTSFIPHLKEAVTMLRTAFTDLHFEIHDMVAEGNLVTFRSTMTGTHSGLFNMPMGRPLPPTGRIITIPHLHMVRIVNGKTTDLWHQWDIPMMLRQLGVMPMPEPQRG